jgi:hypothetical protein
MIYTLPNELISYLFTYIDLKSLINLKRTSKTMENICDENTVYRVSDLCSVETIDNPRLERKILGQLISDPEFQNLLNVDVIYEEHPEIYVFMSKNKLEDGRMSWNELSRIDDDHYFYLLMNVSTPINSEYYLHRFINRCNKDKLKRICEVNKYVVDTIISSFNDKSKYLLFPIPDVILNPTDSYLEYVAVKHRRYELTRNLYRFPNYMDRLRLICSWERRYPGSSAYVEKEIYDIFSDGITNYQVIDNPFLDYNFIIDCANKDTVDDSNVSMSFTKLLIKRKYMGYDSFLFKLLRIWVRVCKIVHDVIY